MKIALTHKVSPNIHQCEITHIGRSPIDYQLAAKQHKNYCSILHSAGLEVKELSVSLNYPDSTFIEDTAVVLDEIAILACMGAKSRRGEVINIEPELAEYRPLKYIQFPATLEGGDVLQMNKQIFVGLSSRTNQEGLASIKEILSSFGYQVIQVSVKDCLHLKSACTMIDQETLLVNHDWLDMEPISGFRKINIAPGESGSANCLSLNEVIYLPEGYPRTSEILTKHGYMVQNIDISELQKAEGGLTCSSIIFNK